MGVEEWDTGEGEEVVMGAEEDMDIVQVTPLTELPQECMAPHLGGVAAAVAMDTAPQGLPMAVVVVVGVPMVTVTQGEGVEATTVDTKERERETNFVNFCTHHCIVFRTL